MSKCTKYFKIEKDDLILMTLFVTFVTFVILICDIVATSPSPPQSRISPTKEFAHFTLSSLGLFWSYSVSCYLYVSSPSLVYSPHQYEPQVLNSQPKVIWSMFFCRPNSTEHPNSKCPQTKLWIKLVEDMFQIHFCPYLISMNLRGKCFEVWKQFLWQK